MSQRKFVTPPRTLNYHVSMRVFPPVPVRAKSTLHEVIRLAQNGETEAIVQWYGRPTTVSQVVEACNLTEFVERGTWVADLGAITGDSSILADFVLPYPDGEIYDYGTVRGRKRP